MALDSMGVICPHYYWLAAREDLPWLTDPDVDDGSPRWDDRELRDWWKIGHDAAAIGVRIAAALDASGLDDDTAEDDISYSAQATNPVDAKIVRSWFWSGAEAPMADPGDDGLMNGRHRLWATWEANPDLFLPIQSTLLQSAADMPLMDAGYAEVVCGELERLLTQMKPTVKKTNPRYVAALEAAHADAKRRSNRT